MPNAHDTQARILQFYKFMPVLLHKAFTVNTANLQDLSVLITCLLLLCILYFVAHNSVEETCEKTCTQNRVKRAVCCVGSLVQDCFVIFTNIGVVAWHNSNAFYSINEVTGPS